jgi:uncharacterized protein
MKSSFYTYYYQQEGKYYIYHQISSALLEVEEDLFRALHENQVTHIPQDIQKTLTAKGFLVGDDVREVDAINEANRMKRYESKVMRLTLMPTMACNFSCWYCYENHHASRMTQEARDAVARFIKKEVEEKNLKAVMLDWFGGEPLLCFDTVMEPLARDIKQWCEEHEVQFVHAITTNGALITPEMALKMAEVRLNDFQITLDGGQEFHNKTRFNKAMPDSFSVIVRNIHTLCRCIPDVSITVRINYTVENFDSIRSILDVFDEDVRSHLVIFPRVVWQEANKIEGVETLVEDLKREAAEMGYRIYAALSACRNCTTCYTENMEQFLVNYDLRVYKCTARDFDGKNAVGVIGQDGTFHPNELFKKFHDLPSPILDAQCQACRYLPSCMNRHVCLQKKLEGLTFSCHPEQQEARLRENLKAKINLLT